MSVPDTHKEGTTMNVKRRAVELLIAGGLLLTWAGVSSVLAQVAPSTGLQRVSGRILSVDPANRLLKLETEKPMGTVSTKKPMDFILSDRTIITDGMRNFQPAELRTGTEVQVKYSVEGGKHIAQSIIVEPSAQTGTPQKPEAAQSAPRGSEPSEPPSYR